MSNKLDAADVVWGDSDKIKPTHFVCPQCHQLIELVEEKGLYCPYCEQGYSLITS